MSKTDSILINKKQLMMLKLPVFQVHLEPIPEKNEFGKQRPAFSFFSTGQNSCEPQEIDLVLTWKIATMLLLCFGQHAARRLSAYESSGSGELDVVGCLIQKGGGPVDSDFSSQQRGGTT